MMEEFWKQRGLRRRLCTGAPNLELKRSSWQPRPGTMDAVIAEPFDSSVEDRECDLQMWQHWAQVEDLRRCLTAAVGRPALVWPRRFRVRAALVSCEGLWKRRQPLTGRLIGGVDVSCMDPLASHKFFAWSEENRTIDGSAARFPCELWQQEHALLLRAPEEACVLCEVDVCEALTKRTWPTQRLQLPEELLRAGQCRAVPHAIATWTEIAAPEQGEPGLSGTWWSTARFIDLGAQGGLRFAVGPSKQGVLLARSSLPASDTLPTEKRQRGAGESEATARSLEVAATFDPGAGELRLRASWSNGSDF
ncbi:unnamed protein product [Polarella glacialis]|uniref:Uncharacterized protein n=1 Tax=Polarella glacialis TaxID=89957 RepID=A0A813LF23_POLGL|nr:unnamed protein product [Polarella glacialis]